MMFSFFRDARRGYLLAAMIYCLPILVNAQSLSIPASAVVKEGDDYATRVIGQPWDMSVGPYPDFTTVLGPNINRSSFSVANGIWSFTTANNDPAMFMVPPSIQSTQMVLKLGDRYPVNTSKYRLLTFRMFSNANTGANVYWFYDQAPHDTSTLGVSQYINVYPGWHTYVINLPQMPTFQGSWTGSIKGFRLDPASPPENTTISLQFDWIRLTSIDTSNVLPISWSGVNPSATVYFYVNNSCSASGATLIGTRTGASSGTFNWGAVLEPNGSLATPYPLPESFQPGQYSVFMLVNNTGQPICAGNTLRVHKAPLLEFQKPSFFSGPDYATERAGDPWGMSNVQDISQTFNLINQTFTNGIFNGTTNGSGDSQVWLNVPTPIDTSRYKYLTFRMRMENTGSVMRALWFYNGVVNAVATDDAVVYEGWHTYSFDLSQALIDPTSTGGWTGTPNNFRIDPEEAPFQVNFNLDFVTLTAEEKNLAGQPFSIYYQPNSTAGNNVTLYYDTDKNPSNGRTIARDYPVAIPPDNNAELNLFTGTQRLWRTNGVPSGSYFISADINDGVMTTTWYSEVPVTVQNFGTTLKGDFDGDGKTDFAVWRPDNGVWYVLRSSNGATVTQQWGLPGDVPVPGDYDNDGKTDYAVWRPASGVWYVINSSNGAQVARQWGLFGDVPVPGDYDSDGKADFAVWRPANGVWYVINSSNGATVIQQFGLPGDVPVPGRYDNDGKTDYAVWRPTNGVWYVLNSTNSSLTTQQWGLNGDVPVPGNYDTDGKVDFAVWRPANGVWYVINSVNGAATSQQWGLPGDVPAPSH
jgi:hypothetical protein